MRIFHYFLLLVSSLFITTAYASEPTLVFTLQPTPQVMGTDTTQTLTYQVRNQVPTQPIQINKIKTMVVFDPSTTAAVAAEYPVSTSCNNLVPAGGTCDITVKLNAGKTSGVVNAELNIYYGTRNTLLSSPINTSVTNGAAVTVVYTQQPASPQTVESGESLPSPLVYKIQNTSPTVPAIYNALVTAPNDFLVPTITSDVCAGTIAPGAICEIDVNVVAANVTDTETDEVNLNVNYGVTSPTIALPASPIDFTISPSGPPPAAELSFVAPNPIAPNLIPDQTGSPLVFTLSNSSGSAVPFTATVTPSQYDSVVSLTNSCGGSVPVGVGTCTVSVTLKANADIQATQIIRQALIINYAGTKNLVASLSYTVQVTSSTALVFSPTPPADLSATIAVSTNASSPVFSYVISNTSNTPLAFQATTPNAVSANDSVEFGNNCGGVVAALSTCTINIYITTTSVPGTVSHDIDVFFAPATPTPTSYPYRIAAIPTVTVTVGSTTGLTFYLVSQPNNVIIGSTTTPTALTFAVQNPTAVPVNLSDINVTNSPDNTGTSTVAIGANPAQLPANVTPCFSGASHFVTLNLNDICYFTVTITAPDGSLPGSITQFLNVVSSATPAKVTQALIYNVLESSLSFLADPTPQIMQQGTTQTLTYGIHNADGTNAVDFDASNLHFTTTSGSGLFSVVFNNSCNGIVSPNGSCQISALITGNTVGIVKGLSLIIPDSTGSTLLASVPNNFSIVNQAVPKRTLTFVNDCPATSIWIGLNGGASNNVTSSAAPPNPHIAPGTSSICNTNADCPNGTTCVTTNVQTNTKLCFWNNSMPTGGYELAPGGGTATAILPEYNQIVANDKNIVWSGNVSARTGCGTDQLCQTADCTGASTTVTANVNQPDSTQGCLPGIGFTPPNALAEFTLSRMSSDFYDDSIINGANVPISMRPTTLTAYQTTQNGNNAYICGEPGKSTATSNGPGAASWIFTPPAVSSPPPTQYVNVLYDANEIQSCTSNAICTQSPGDVCGLTFNPTLNSFASQCGQFLGYWTGDQICGTNSGSGANSGFNCSGSVTMTGFTGLTVTNLYKCDAGIPSCYNNPNSNNSCCGCADWSDVPTVGSSNVPAAPLVEACPLFTANSAWNTSLQVGGAGTPNNIAWLKAAVPSAYTYPFDDPSSTFTCPNCTSGPGQPTGSGGCVVPSTEFNTSDYTITFCPAGALIPPPA